MPYKFSPVIFGTSIQRAGQLHQLHILYQRTLFVLTSSLTFGQELHTDGLDLLAVHFLGRIHTLSGT